MTTEGEAAAEDHTDDLVAIIDSWVQRGIELDGRIADLEQDRSDVWRALGIPQDADADAAIAAIVVLRATDPAARRPAERDGHL